MKRFFMKILLFFLSADPVIADKTVHLSNKEYYELDGFKLAQLMRNKK